MADRCTYNVCRHRKPDARFRCRVDQRAALLKKAQTIYQLASALSIERNVEPAELEHLVAVAERANRLIDALVRARERDIENMLGMDG